MFFRHRQVASSGQVDHTPMSVQCVGACLAPPSRDMRLRGIMGLVLVLLATGTAHAQEIEMDPMLGERGLREDELRFEDWRRFHPVEYAVVPTVLGAAFTLRFAVPHDPEPNWRGGILFDDAAFDALFVRDDNTRHAVKWMGDVPYIASFAWSVADPVIAGAVHNWDLANQMFWMNLEAYSVTASVLWTSQWIVKRERPRAREFCDDPATAPPEADCGKSGAVASFIGGHTATVMTAAVLTCIHHSEMPIYGGGAGDAMPCAAGMASTALVFTARTLGGGHYVTDNIFGLALGSAAGLLPWALHYKMEAPTPEADKKSHTKLTSVAVAPDPSSSGAVLQFAGLW